MVLTENGIIKFSDIQSEFGGINPIYISEYYLNSATGYTGGTAGIPNSNSMINISFFKGKEKIIVVLPTSSLYARYSAEGPFTFNANNFISQWNDISGNNRHITSAYFRGNVSNSTFTCGSKGLVGSSILPTVSGNDTDGLYFPFSLTRSSYTFCYMARYRGDKNNTTYNRRIFDSRSGTGANTYWGFQGGTPGKSFNGNTGNISSTEYKQSEPDWWIIGIETETTCRFNGMDCTDTRILGGLTYPLRPIAGFNPTPSINFGNNTGQLNSTETSYWEITELLFYNTELTLADKIAVENYFSNKYKHISFSNVSSTFNTFTSNCSNIISLYNGFNTIYNGLKWGYSSNNSKWFGPGILYSQFYLKNSRYYWLLNLQNNITNTVGLKYNNSGNRNISNVSYNILLPLNTIATNTNYKIHCILNGGGGGGSYFGASAGGQCYFYNATNLLYNTTVNLNIGNKGFSYSYGNTNCSAGGDTTLSWSTYSLTGNGGREGDTQFNASTFSNIAPAGLLVGGQGGGGSFNYNFGGAISTITNTINLYPDTTLWSIINDPNIANVYSYNSTLNSLRSPAPNILNVYGAGGMSYKSANNGVPGGPGFVIIIFDYN
jgi:hypothetical protein